MIPIYIFIGGGIGAVLRYFLSGIISRNFGTHFPYGTLAVNIFGCFCMGVLIEYLSKTMPHSIELRYFLAVGVLGGFTTFSAFSLEVITLFERNQPLLALIYISSSVIFSILGLFAGMLIIRGAIH